METAPRTRCTLALEDQGSPASTLDVGLFIVTRPEAGDWAVAEAEALGRDGLRDAAAILAACELGLRVQAAAVVSAPAELLDVEGNEEGAWGGMAPEGEPDPDAFNHALNERLSPEPRALFEHARTSLSPGAIAIVVVDSITYWAGGEARLAGGLSFPPVVYHHEDDHPTRNGVLVAASYPGPGALPTRVNGLTIAHELGHMLLDTAQHSGPEDGLMQAGDALTAEQCATMRETAAGIYGDATDADP